MRPKPSIAIALAATLTVFASLTAVTRARTASPFDPQPTPPPAHECVGEIAQQRMPDALVLGDTVALTLTFRATCQNFPVHPLLVVLVADPSAGMGASGFRDMRGVMAKLVDRLALVWYDPGFDMFFGFGDLGFVAVVDVGDKARVRTVLTNDPARSNAAIQRVRAGGDTRIAPGIEEGVRMLRLARQSLDPRIHPDLGIVVFSDGRCAGGCDEAIRASRKAGIPIVTVCVGNDCDERCLREVASRPSYFFHASDDYWPPRHRVLFIHPIISVLTPFHEPRIPALVNQLVVTQTLAADVDYVPDSAVPAAGVQHGGKTLVWSTNWVPEDGVTFTMRVKPRVIGQSDITQRFSAWFGDNRGSTYALTAPTPPPVTVIEPFPSAPTRTPQP